MSNPELHHNQPASPGPHELRLAERWWLALHPPEQGLRAVGMACCRVLASKEAGTSTSKQVACSMLWRFGAGGLPAFKQRRRMAEPTARILCGAAPVDRPAAPAAAAPPPEPVGGVGKQVLCALAGRDGTFCTALQQQLKNHGAQARSECSTAPPSSIAMKQQPSGKSAGSPGCTSYCASLLVKPLPRPAAWPAGKRGGCSDSKLDEGGKSFADMSQDGQRLKV